jgi:hypothetical protein
MGIQHLLLRPMISPIAGLKRVGVGDVEGDVG